MSLTYGFYNSVGGDRTYSAIQMSSIFDGIIEDGVFMSIGDNLVVSAGAGMNITVGTGRAWFNHTWTNVDAQIPLTVQQAELVLNRIDAVVLEINSDDAVRANTIKIIKGIPATNPVNPVLTHTALVNQYPLAYIYVGANVVSINQGNITNKVGTSDCPFVTGVLETMDIDILIAQWNTQFNTWFASVQGTLSGDVAGNLLTLINGIKAENVDKQFMGVRRARYNG
jgi:hypothetical protein